MENTIHFDAIKKDFIHTAEQRRDHLIKSLTGVTSEAVKNLIIKEIISLTVDINEIKADLEGVGIFIPPTRPNLIARTFSLRKDHGKRILSVGGIITNSGTTLQAPFKVTIGITSTFLDEGIVKTLFFENTFEVPGNVIIPGNGGQYITAFTEVPLHYITDSSHNRYVLEMIVDSGHNILEGFEGDNYVNIPYFTGRPHH